MLASAVVASHSRPAHRQHCLHNLAAIFTAVNCRCNLCASCRALKHAPPSLLELSYKWQVFGSTSHSLELSHLTALTKLTTGNLILCLVQCRVSARLALVAYYVLQDLCQTWL
jgi:hypothetical protein